MTIRQASITTVPNHIYTAVAQASQQVGVSFSYLMNKASTESSFQNNAAAKTSSATGLYQFVERTWLDMVDKYGAQCGLNDAACAISRKNDGSPTVADRATRKDILELRKDPTVSAFMAAQYANENRQALEKSLHRSVNDTELYLAHFLGAGGAAKFLKGMAQNSQQDAAALLPEAAAANQSVFYNKEGDARSLKQIYDRFATKFSPNKTYVAENTAPVSTPVVMAQAEAGSLGTFLAQSRMADAQTHTATTVGQILPTQAGAVPSAARPFLSTYLMAALQKVEENTTIDSANRSEISSYYAQDILHHSQAGQIVGDKIFGQQA